MSYEPNLPQTMDNGAWVWTFRMNLHDSGAALVLAIVVVVQMFIILRLSRLVKDQRDHAAER